jgi:hypothetical protein
MHMLLLFPTTRNMTCTLRESYPDRLTFNVILLASPDPDEPATEAVPEIPASTGVVTSHSSTEASVIGTGTCEGPG